MKYGFLLFLMIYLSISKFQDKIQQIPYFKKYTCYTCTNLRITKDNEQIKEFLNSTSYQPDEVFLKLITQMMSLCLKHIDNKTLNNFGESLKSQNMENFNCPDHYTKIDFKKFTSKDFQIELTETENEMYSFMNELNEDLEKFRSDQEQERERREREKEEEDIQINDDDL